VNVRHAGRDCSREGFVGSVYILKNIQANSDHSEMEGVSDLWYNFNFD
jgi:hypothetical protein